MALIYYACKSVDPKSSVGEFLYCQRNSVLLLHLGMAYMTSLLTARCYFSSDSIINSSQLTLFCSSRPVTFAPARNIPSLSCSGASKARNKNATMDKPRETKGKRKYVLT